MKAIRILFVAVVALFAGALTAQAGGPFKFGPRVGATFNKLSFDKSDWDNSNRAGWTAGMTADFTVPVIGIGADLSAMYVRRNVEHGFDNRDYIEIPLNLKYKLSLPAVNNLVTPYIGVGPSVSFLTSRKNIENAYKNKAVDWALNFGIGVELLNRIDINARYGLGLTKAVTALTALDNKAGIEGKNRYWTITVGYYF